MEGLCAKPTLPTCKRIVYTHRFVRILFAQGLCPAHLYRSNFDGGSPRRIETLRRPQFCCAAFRLTLGAPNALLLPGIIGESSWSVERAASHADGLPQANGNSAMSPPRNWRRPDRWSFAHRPKLETEQAQLSIICNRSGQPGINCNNRCSADA